MYQWKDEAGLFVNIHLCLLRFSTCIHPTETEDLKRCQKDSSAFRIHWLAESCACSLLTDVSQSIYNLFIKNAEWISGLLVVVLCGKDMETLWAGIMRNLLGTLMSLGLTQETYFLREMTWISIKINRQPASRLADTPTK